MFNKKNQIYHETNQMIDKMNELWGRPESFFSGRLRHDKKVSQGRGAPQRANP